MSAIVFNETRLAIGGRIVLDGVSFSIPDRVFVAVLGANGAGKTTLIRATLGLLPLAGGSIEVLGREPRKGNAGIGYMPQFRRNSSLANLTGFDLVLSASGGSGWGWPRPAQDDRRMAADALAEVDATALAQRPLTELSGGERQRVLLAQALLGDPRLLLLDEPLASLDPGHQRGIVEAVQRVAKRRSATVLFCAHEINPLIEAVDLVLYLGNGSAALGTVDEVINARVLTRLYKTPIHVTKIDGRIFVMARDGELHSCEGHREVA